MFPFGMKKESWTETNESQNLTMITDTGKFYVTPTIQLHDEKQGMLISAYSSLGSSSCFTSQKGTKHFVRGSYRCQQNVLLREICWHNRGLQHQKMKEAHFQGNSLALLSRQHAYKSSYSVGRQPDRDSGARENSDKSLCFLTIVWKTCIQVNKAFFSWHSKLQKGNSKFLIPA